MTFTPDERTAMQRAATQDLLAGLDRGVLPEPLAVDMVTLHGVDTNEAQPGTGLKPLHLAVAQDMARLVNALLDAGADACATNNAGTTPLGVLALTHLDKKTVSPAARMIARRLIAAGAQGVEVPHLARTTPIGDAIHQILTLNQPPIAAR